MRILFYFFWPYGIVAPPRIDPRLQWKCRVLTTGLPGRSSVRILDLSLYISRFTLPCLNPERWWKRKNLCASLCSVLCFAQIHIPWVSDVICLILCRPPLLLPPVFPSIRVFSSESALHIRWPKYRSLATVLVMNIQGWFPLGLTGLISYLLAACIFHSWFPNVPCASAFLSLCPCPFTKKALTIWPFLPFGWHLSPVMHLKCHLL